jgi:hypothetical protein
VASGKLSWVTLRKANLENYITLLTPITHPPPSFLGLTEEPSL